MKGAQLYQRLGWRLIPIHSVRADGRCTCGHTETVPTVCECGNPKCERRHGAGSIGKHPRVPGWTSAASAKAEQHDEWGQRWPGCNVGVATGTESGVIVLDEDPHNGGDKTLTQLEAQHGPLPRTAVQRTGGGGRQFFFEAGSTPFTNSASKIGPGLDFRAEGGQVVLPPSVSGKGSYAWIHNPWQTLLAPAPAWLLAMVGRGHAGAAPSERGYFPVATADVLEQAGAALARHGPAVDGDGGGLHTVHGAAILTHDFALTDEEAWPLFEAWNRSCVPPWEPGELRERLRRGRLYGKQPYGCRRELDVVSACQKEITDWQTAGCERPAMFLMIDSVKALLATCRDAVRRDVVEAELSRATGVKPKALKAPRPPPEPPKQGEIRVTPELHKVADEALTAIAPRVFARNGLLCEVAAAGGRTWIHDLEPARIQDVMSAASKYVRPGPEGELVLQAPPLPVASILHARRHLPGVRVLEAVTSAPIFLANGTILQERGYNSNARVFLEPNVSVDVPEAPTRADARAAVALFRELLSDFSFATPADFSTWLAAVLSPLVKAATRNAPSPLFLISASTAGAGKSLLAQLIAEIVTGAGAEIRPYSPKDDAEWGKRLTAFLKAASPITVFDNANGEIGDPALDRLITSDTWSDRQLGASEAPPLPNVTTWLATGNNLEPRGDTVRRVLVVRLEVMVERPQERTGFKRNLAGGYALEHRAALLGAALTLLRAYHCAGRPAQVLAPWTFGSWGDLVRGALVWADCADPYETQRRAQLESNEPEHEAHDFWLQVVGESDGSPAGIVLMANQRGAQETLGMREQLTVRRLRAFLSRFVDKVRGGRRIRCIRVATGTRYTVEAVDAVNKTRII